VERPAGLRRLHPPQSRPGQRQRRRDRRLHPLGPGAGPPRHPRRRPARSGTGRHAYIDAATRAGETPDEATVTAYLAQVAQANADASAELERRYPPGFFDDGRPKTPTEDELRGELHELYARQQRDPAIVRPDEWANVQARLSLLAGQVATEERSRQLSWVLPAEAGNDPGVAPEAVQALTTPPPWTPRQPTQTEQALAELDQLDHEAATLGDDAA
jgi:hypothetical protein